MIAAIKLYILSRRRLKKSVKDLEAELDKSVALDFMVCFPIGCLVMWRERKDIKERLKKYNEGRHD